MAKKKENCLVVGDIPLFGEQRGMKTIEFTKLCPECFGEVNAVLRRIRKESKRKEDTHAKD